MIKMQKKYYIIINIYLYINLLHNIMKMFVQIEHIKIMLGLNVNVL